LKATQKSTGKVLLSNSGNLPAAAFKKMLSSMFPCVDKDDIQVDDGTSLGEFGRPPPKGRSVVWKGSFCFPPGSKVMTLHGVKDIADVNPGDMVLTHLGRFRKVLNKSERLWEGVMVSIHTAIDSEEIILSDGHGVFCVKGQKCLLRPSQTCKPTCKTQRNTFVAPSGTRFLRCTKGPWQRYTVEKSRAGDLTTNDFLFLPKLREEQRTHGVNIPEALSGVGNWATDGEWIWPSRSGNKTSNASIARSMGVKENWVYGATRISPENKARVEKAMLEAKQAPPIFDEASQTNRIPSVHKLTYDFGRFLGLFVAEGSGGNVSSFAFNQKETELHDFVTRFIQSMFFLKTTRADDKRNNGTSIYASSVILASALTTWCGDSSTSKRVPWFIFSANDDVISGFINGMWDGDGNKNPRRKDNTLKYCTVSPSLAYGLRLLLSKFGVTAAISVETCNESKQPAYMVRISGEQLYENKWLNEFRYNKIPSRPKHPKTREYFSTDQGSFVKIKCISNEPYQGLVYDLEVEEDSSYTVCGKAVANSDLGGYANMNREICTRLLHHGIQAKPDMLRTPMQIDDMTKAILNAMAGTRVPESSPLVVGFTPMPVEKKGRKVVFYTMMETQTLHPEFSNRCNISADEIWIPCKFYIDVFRASGVCKPMRLMPLGVNQHLYTPDAKEPKLRYEDILGNEAVLELPDKFRFMSLFGWSYRKGPDALCRAFIREFSAKDDACLVIYSRYACSSAEEHKEKVRAEIRGYYAEQNKADAPPIYYCGDEIPILDLPGCYAAADCFVFCSRGEGFGLPVIEAGACGIPVVSTYNTAMTEYLDESVAGLVRCDDMATADDKLTWISEFYRGQKFPVLGEKEVSETSRLMRNAYNQTSETKERAERFRKRILEDYTWDKCASRVAERLKSL